jgi:hypothetical protein
MWCTQKRRDIRGLTNLIRSTRYICEKTRGLTPPARQVTVFMTLFDTTHSPRRRRRRGVS